MNLTEISSIDKYVFLVLNGRHSPFFDYVMYASGNLLFWCPLYAAIIYCIVKISKSTDNSLENVVLNVVMIIFLSVICVVIFPPFFDTVIPRLKPCHNPDIYMSVRLVGTECGSGFGFFAHRVCFASALSTYMLLILPRNFKGLKFTLIFWAILVSYSRIYDGDHYPLNVLTASAVGIMSGIFIYRVYSYFKNSLLLI